MALLSPPPLFIELNQLVAEFNAISADQHISRLFYLQKMNYILNKTPMNTELYHWINHSGDEGFQKQLLDYSIEPNASFFCKGIQFAQAVALLTSNKPVLNNIIQDYAEYELMQERDHLLQKKHTDIMDTSYSKKKCLELCEELYIKVSCELAHLADNNERIKKIIIKHKNVLLSAQPKLQHIKGNSSGPGPNGPYYSTKPLSETPVNNFNFKFSMGGWRESFVFRVEDRPMLNLEQELHSHEVAKFFIEDFAVFMMAFENKAKEIEYKPVILSQFANQGDLGSVAKHLKKEPKRNIAAIASYYFIQLAEFCEQLMKANVYHPDIKLSNFLVHNNRVLISDRKTLINQEQTEVRNIRCSPFYAPEELVECLNRAKNGYQTKLKNRIVTMPQYMAYQLGMALKEFLILSQVGELPEEEFRDIHCTAASYFRNPSQQVLNLSLLVQELTRDDPKTRLSIKQFHSLLQIHRYKKHSDFYNEVEKVLPNSELGISEEIQLISDLTASNHKGFALMNRANPLFQKVIASNKKESRLIRYLEKLALECYSRSSKQFFAKISAKIELEFYNNDWLKAPWYKRALHFLSLGYLRVDRLSSISDISLDGFELNEFNIHVYELEFLSPQVLIKDLGENQTRALSQFIDLHIDKIIPSKEPETICKATETKTDNETASLLHLNEKNTSSAPPLSGTILYTDQEPNPSEVPTLGFGSSHEVFFKAGRPASIRSSILRGDRYQEKSARPPLSQVNWETPSP